MHSRKTIVKNGHALVFLPILSTMFHGSTLAEPGLLSGKETALPGLEIPSAGIALDGDHTAALRAGDPPLIARVRDGRTIVDLRERKRNRVGCNR